MKKNYIKYILFAITLLLIAYLVYIFMTNYLFKPDNNGENTVTTPEPEYGSKVAEYMGYSYNMIGDYYYQIQKGSEYQRMTLFDNVSHCGGNVVVLSKSDFDSDSFDSLESLEKLLTSSGDNVKNGQIIKRNDKDILVFEHYYETNTGLIAYMNAYDDYIYQILVYDDENSLNYDALNNIADILNSATKITEGTN